MNLENHIRWAIYNFPTLYRADTYQDSRMKVLDHIFFCVSTGYDWHPNGYLTSGSSRNVLKELPPEFFNVNLFYFQPLDLKAALDAIGHRFYYIRKEDGNRSTTKRYNTVYFEAESHEDAMRFADFDFRYLQEKERHKDHPEMDDLDRKLAVHEASSHSNTRHPYPLSKYSAVNEMIHGETCSPHHASFKINPKQDWIDGCMDAVNDAIEYFNNKERHSSDIYYSDTMIRQYCSNETIKQFKSLNVNIRKQFKAGETIETYSTRVWEDYRQTSLNTLLAFTAKFAANS